MRCKKNILAIVQLPPPVHGASIMNKIVIDSKLINENYSLFVVPIKFASSISDIGKFGALKSLKVFPLAIRIVFNIFKNKPDLVYFTLSPVGLAFYRDLLFVALLKILKQRVLFHIHGKGIKNASKNYINNICYKWIFSDIGSHVVLLSEILYSDVENYVDQKRCFYLPNGIPSCAEMGRKKHRIVHFLYLSNMVIEKGPIVLIKALVGLKKKGIEFRATFVGAEHSKICMEQFNKTIIEEGLGDFVKYVGPKYEEEKKEIIRCSDVLVFPTFYPNECFPLVLLEAMSNGLAVVSTPEGAISDIVQDGVTGFLVKQKDDIELSHKLEILAKNIELRESMGKEGRKKFEEKYTKEIFESNLNRIFESCVSV